MAELLCDRRDLVAQVSLGQGWAVCLKQYMHFKYEFEMKNNWFDRVEKSSI